MPNHFHLKIFSLFLLRRLSICYSLTKTITVSRGRISVSVFRLRALSIFFADIAAAAVTKIEASNKAIKYKGSTFLFHVIEKGFLTVPLPTPGLFFPHVSNRALIVILRMCNYFKRGKELKGGKEI